MPDITLTGVQKTYPGSSVKAVEDLDLVIRDGEFMCLLGPSGCGKTTTLRMIAGLEQPTAGRIAIGDNVVDSVSEAVFVPPEKRGLGLVFQSYALWPHMTVEQNVDFGLQLRKMDRAARVAQRDRVMELLGISEFAKRYPGQLSGGQQQRVSLARMLAVNPGVLLLDEPLSNLDARLRLEMRRELKRIHREFGTTVVFVTHDQWEAMTLATTIAVMSRGELQQVGTPDEIYGQPANRFVAEFVGSPPINLIALGAENSGLAAALREQVPALLAAEATTVGIRPEAVRINAAAATGGVRGQATVGGVLPTGGNWIIELDYPGGRLIAITSEYPTVAEGDTVTYQVPEASLHVFADDSSRVA